MRYHHQNLTDGKLPLWRAGRAWWRRIGWEWHIFQRSYSWGIAFGKRHLSIRLPGFSFYLHGRDHEPFDAREFSLTAHGGSVWLTLIWADPHGTRTADPWWKKTTCFPVVDWLLGDRRYKGDELETRKVWIPLPEGSYEATAVHMAEVWRRRWYCPKLVKDSWKFDIEGGIPFAGKGENSWDCGDDGTWSLSFGESCTLEEGIGKVVAHILTMRKRRGHDSKDTGRVPLLVVNQDYVAPSPPSDQCKQARPEDLA